MRQAIIATGAALLLASCGSADKAGNAAAPAANGAAPAAGKATTPASGTSAAAVVQLRPGQWETRVEILHMDVPNMPQGVTLPKQAPVTVHSCLTPDQARRPNAGFVTGGRNQNGCNYENFSMAGGRMQGVVTCNRQGAATRTSVNGTFGPEAYQMEAETRVSTSGVTVNSVNRVSGRRLGDCPG